MLAIYQHKGQNLVEVELKNGDEFGRFHLYITFVQDVIVIGTSK